MKEQRLYMGWKCHLGVHVYRVVGGKFLALPLKCPRHWKDMPEYDWGDDVLGQRALALALAQDVIHSDHITEAVCVSLCQQFVRMTHRDLPWIFTERVIRELCTHQLKRENNCFPLGIWARALDGESAAEVLAK